MRFDSPQMLWILLLPLLLVLQLLRGKLSAYHKKILWLQVTVALLLIAALANPVVDKFQKGGSAAVVVDISDSVNANEMSALYERALDLTKNLPDSVLIPFAGKSAIFPASSGSIASYQDLVAAQGQDALKPARTNLQDALRLAANSSANVLLVSDGFQNSGNVFSSPEIFSSKIFPLVPENASGGTLESVVISALDVPLVASVKKSVDLRSSLQNNSASAQRGRLSVYHDQKKVFSEEVSLAPGEERLVTAQSDSELEGLKQVRAVFEPNDKRFPPSTRIAYLAAERREKVLLLSGSSEDSKLLRQAFETQSYELVESGSGESTSKLSDFSVVILNNIPASQLPSGFSSNLSEYVRAGGGFVMIGGNRSYGLGGYVGTAIADLLPVDPLPPQAQQKRLTVAVELVIDKSRSMADDNRLEFAKAAAREVVRNLKDEDFVGVIGFDSSPFEVVKLGRLAEIRPQAMERIGRLFPAQKTNLFPALDEGRRRLEAVNAGRKHMIILTDGKIPDADQSYNELVKQMRLSGITVSTVLVGSDFDFGFLRGLAERGGGAFYQTTDPSSLPRIFLQDVKVRSGEQTMREQNEFPVFVGPSGIVSTKIGTYPDLLGFVETRAKERAALELIVRSQDSKFPLLASWSLGQGKVIAFTSDANGRWSRQWASWSRFVPFWTELLDSVRTQGTQSPLRFDLRQHVEGDAISIDLTLFEDPKAAPIQAKLIAADGKAHSLAFSESAKGMYHSQLPGVQGGRYEFQAKVGSRALTTVAFQVDDVAFREQKGLGFNIPLLNQLVEMSGGKINPLVNDLQRSKLELAGSTSYRWHLMCAAFLLYLFGILWRELRISLRTLVKPMTRSRLARAR